MSEILITEAQIADRIPALAGEIVAALPAEARSQLHMVGLLKGAFLFMADLGRALRHRGVEVSFDFMTLSSYGDGTVSSGQVKLVQDLTEPIEGRHVLLVDDIVDSGRTIAFAHEHLAKLQPASLTTALFMDKPARREVQVEVDHIGFTVPNRFVIGYGGDHAQRYRDLPWIAALD